MGVEVVHTKAVTRYLIWGSMVVMAACVLATWALLVAADPKQGGILSALLLPVHATMGAVVSGIVGVIFIAFFLFITVVYSFSFARLIFVSGLDRRLPPALSHVNRFKIPHRAIILQAVLAGIACSIIGAIASFFGMWTVFANPFSTQLFGKTDWWHAVLAIVAVSLAVVPILYLIGTRTGRSAELPAEARTADVV